jgi:mannose/cellobiose epimerase-like protein (N-acyl-D-glucosamine 2-epimerase family)
MIRIGSKTNRLERRNRFASEHIVGLENGRRGDDHVPSSEMLVAPADAWIHLASACYSLRELGLKRKP